MPRLWEAPRVVVDVLPVVWAAAPVTPIDVLIGVTIALAWLVLCLLMVARLNDDWRGRDE